MSRASEVLEQLRRAEAAARGEIQRLLSPAGLEVGEIRPDDDGWYVRIVPRRTDSRIDAGRRDDAVLAAAAAPEMSERMRGVAPLVRQPGETLIALASRAGDRLRVPGGEGPGGLRTPSAPEEERIGWLAGTLVGDTLLALRHLGDAEDGERAVGELHRQLGLFRQESRRLLGSMDPAPFLSAVDRWTPAAFPRGRAFLAQGEGVAHA